MTTISKPEAIERIIQVFREYGYEGASLALLSKATGLGRSSLYHHFPKGKEDMAAVALDAVLQSFGEMVLSPLLQTEVTPVKRLRACSKGLSKFYADGNRSCLLNIFSLGAAGKIFHKTLDQSTQTMISMFTDIAKEAGIPTRKAKQRGENLVMNIQGALVLSRTLGTNTAFKRLIKEIPDQLLNAD